MNPNLDNVQHLQTMILHYLKKAYVSLYGKENTVVMVKSTLYSFDDL